MGNSLNGWLTTYDPTLNLEHMNHSQLCMEHCRHMHMHVLEQMGPVWGSPGAGLSHPADAAAGAAFATLPALPSQQPQPAELEQQLDQIQQQQRQNSRLLCCCSWNS
jgi:hypothetical protein